MALEAAVTPVTDESVRKSPQGYWQPHTDTRDLCVELGTGRRYMLFLVWKAFVVAGRVS